MAPKKKLFYDEPSNAHVQPDMTDSKRLFNKPDHADMKIYIGDYQLPAHSVVLAVQSPFFQKALNEKFCEGKAKEFYFKEGSAHAHWRVFEYLYTGTYAEEPVQVLDTQGWREFKGESMFKADIYIDDNEFVKDVRVYTTAEFFMLDDLKHLALQRFKSKLDRRCLFNNGLSDDKAWVSEPLFGCIREIYASTTKSEHGLRSAVVELVHTYRAELWQRKAFQDLVYDGGEFAVDLMGKCIGRKNPFGGFG